MRELKALARLEVQQNLCKWALSKRPKNGFQYQISLNTGPKYCRMLQGEHSAILSTFIKLPLVIKIFVLFVYEWPLYTGVTVHAFAARRCYKSSQILCVFSCHIHTFNLNADRREWIHQVSEITTRLIKHDHSCKILYICNKGSTHVRSSI